MEPLETVDIGDPYMDTGEDSSCINTDSVFRIGRSAHASVAFSIQKDET